MRFSYYLFLLFFILYTPTIVLSKETIKDKWQDNIPKSASQLIEQGRNKGRLLKFDDAIESFEKAIDIKRDYYWATLNLAIAYSISSGDQMVLAEETFLKAEEIAKRNNIKDPMLYDSLGQLYFKQKRYDEAVTQYEKALSIDKKYVSAMNNLGAVLETLKKKGEALSHYKRAKDLGLPIATINYKRLLAIVEKEKKENAPDLPETYFINKRRGDQKKPPTYFDNDGNPGMAGE